MPPYTLPFEKPIQELERRLQDLRAFSESQNIDVSRELSDLLRQGVIAKERGAIVIRRPDILRRAVEAELEAEACL